MAHTLAGGILLEDLVAKLHQRVVLECYERCLYGDSVVDAYTDVNVLRYWLQRRLPYRSGVFVVQMAYKILPIADRGGIPLGGLAPGIRQNP